jgi:hypothetical protein
VCSCAREEEAALYRQSCLGEGVTTSAYIVGRGMGGGGGGDMRARGCQ